VDGTAGVSQVASVHVLAAGNVGLPVQYDQVSSVVDWPKTLKYTGVEDS